MKPRFTHPCKKCVYLGSTTTADLYFHHGKHDALIARLSNKLSHYKGGPYYTLNSPDLIEAQRLAQEQGLIE